MDVDQGTVTVEKVVAIALDCFATGGFDDTRLESIAQRSGMSKRMIHYHFGDKRGLYVKALQLAIARLRPDPSEMALETEVPVEAMGKIVNAIYDCMVEEENSVRLVTMENLFGQADMLRGAPLADQSSVVLQMERILMMGQDAGAFRPGIAAVDVYAIVASLCMFRVTNRATFANLYGTDMTDEENLDGMRRLVRDAVLAFLTSNMRNTGGMSYLVGTFGQTDGGAQSIYEDHSSL
ncbi:TetR family transcriptional regulator [Corynebacterium aquilae DSM 44791]|uniref:TetR family transcriptional regulator n=1 Tax=Corynebacterium aquilae DSM 44791 TaxID=1431546 RepID=A0A1L7CHC8_9CORY|nr:TetR family transcriptional regulator [Corynebacterium aquilae DSM 44791]